MMDVEEFREAGKRAIDFIADYRKNIRSLKVLPDVKPGFLHEILPTEAPEEPESWLDIESDIKEHILPGLTHWTHPNFFAYFPAVPSFVSILAEIIDAGLACPGFIWISNPSSTEMEVIVLDWLAKILNLPEEFLSTSEGHGGGIIYSTASESIYVSLLSARTCIRKQLLEEKPHVDLESLNHKLVAYSSDQSNLCVMKACNVTGTLMRTIKSENDGSLQLEEVKRAVEEDIRNGFIPFFICVTLGTTSTCSFDNLKEIGPYCKKQGMWISVDAAFAGGSFACPELRGPMEGMEYADSFVFNPHKWLSINFDCSTFWIKDRRDLLDTFSIEGIYLKDISVENKKAPEFKNWEISLGRRFRALKLWSTIRCYGVKGFQEYIRRCIYLTHVMKDLIKQDERFEIFEPVNLSLVCFRLKAGNKPTKKLIDKILSNKILFMISTELHGVAYIRYSVTNYTLTEEDIQNSWSIISSTADEIGIQ